MAPLRSPIGTPPDLNHPDGLVLRIVQGGTRWEVLARGGEGLRPFARPDNLGFDRDGTVIVATDIESEGEEDLLRKVDNNGLFRVGDPQGRLLRAPDGAEVCGPIVTPDHTGILCSIQHPDPAWNQGRSTVGMLTPA